MRLGRHGRRGATSPTIAHDRMDAGGAGPVDEPACRRATGSPAGRSLGSAAEARSLAVRLPSRVRPPARGRRPRRARPPAYAPASPSTRDGGIADSGHRGGHDEQPDHDPGRLARRPRLERIDDERVAQRPVAQLLGDELEIRVGRRVDLVAAGGRSSSSRRRSGSPARRPSRSSGPPSRPPRRPRMTPGRPPRPPPSSAA